MKHKAKVTQSAVPVLAKYLTWECLAFVAALAFLVPFSPLRNSAIQGLILILAGATGWLAVLLRRPFGLKAHAQPVVILGAIYALSILISLAFSPYFSYGLLGLPYVRLGAAGLLACLGCGLCLETIQTEWFVVGLYYLTCAFAIASVAYTWLHFHSLIRIGGLFSQADLFAVIVGCGFLLGVHLYASHAKNRPLLCVLQTILGVLLICSETRAVIGLVIAILVIWLLHERAHWSARRLLLLALIGVLALGVLTVVAPKRITSVSYGAASIRYRLELQEFGLSQALKEPLWGYGPGNLPNVLGCNHIKAAMLARTCQQGYFFNSTHNIFLDRILMFGWVGGLAFASLIGIVLYRAYTSPDTPIVLVFCALLISFYYLTNVTNIEVELLLWVLVCHMSFSRSPRPIGPKTKLQAETGSTA